MALKYATKSGAWSDPTVWNGGTLPAGQDVVLANNFTVTIDQDVDLSTGAATVTAGSFVVGQRYRIVTLGTTSFTSIGAILQMVDVEFVATGAGSGTGTAITVSQLGNYASSPAVAGGKFVVSGTRTLTLSLFAGTTAGATVLEISANANVTINGCVSGSQSTGVSGRVINLMGTCTLTVNGSVISSTSATSFDTQNAVIYSAAGSGTHTITVNGFLASGPTAYAEAIKLSSTAVVTINGNIYVRGTSGGSGVIFIQTAPATITVNGNIYCGTVSGAAQPGVYLSVNGCSYTQAGDIYTGYGSGVACSGATMLVLFKLTGNIVASGTGSSSAYGVDIATSAGSFINGNIESGAAGGFKGQGGPMKFIGTLTKGLATPTLLMFGGGSGTTPATIDFSEATIGYATGGAPSGNVIYSNGTGGILTCTLPEIVQKGSSTYLYSSCATRLTIEGDVVTQGTGYGIYISDSAPHSVVINGSCIAGGETAFYASGSSSSTYLITGDAVGGSYDSGACGVSVNAGSLTIKGNVVGGSYGSDNYGLSLNDSATNLMSCSVEGDITGGTTGSAGCYLFGAAANTLTVHGSIYATASSIGIAGAISAGYGVGKLVVHGAAYDHSSGTAAIWYRNVVPEPTASFHKFTKTGAAIVMHSSGVWSSDAPAASDVRAGVNYGAGGGYTGTCVVPSPSAVVAGIPVDHTVGLAVVDLSAMLTPAEISEAVRTELTPELTRLANCATVETTGAQLAAFEAP